MVVAFHPRSRTEVQNARRSQRNPDFVSFYRDDSLSTRWGPRIAGGQGWPGVGGTPPLVIPADTAILHFHSDAVRRGGERVASVRAPLLGLAHGRIGSPCSVETSGAFAQSSRLPSLRQASMRWSVRAGQASALSRRAASLSRAPQQPR